MITYVFLSIDNSWIQNYCYCFVNFDYLVSHTEKMSEHQEKVAQKQELPLRGERTNFKSGRKISKKHVSSNFDKRQIALGL
jgi:hypothetical protein